MSISSIFTRRILATILFITSTFGVLMFLPHNPLLKTLWSGTNDTPVYALFLVLILILSLVLIGLVLSQNSQFLINLRDHDERSQLIKKDIILKSFFGIFLILILWLFGQYLFTFAIFQGVEFGLFASDTYWLRLGGYFVLVPVLVFPFVIALWTDQETKLINPFLTSKSYFISSAQIILVPLIIILSFGSLAINDLLTKDPINSDINKSEIFLLGDANFEITIDPSIVNGEIFVDSNTFNSAQMLILNYTPSTEFEPKSSNEQISGFRSGMNNYPANQSPVGSLSVNAGYRYQLTQKIFTTPAVHLRLKELKKLTLLNTMSVKITVANGKCLDQDSLKLGLQGNSFGNLELPCNAKPSDFKNLEDLRF